MAKIVKREKFVPDPKVIKDLEKMEKEIHAGIVKYYETGMLLQKISKEEMYKHRGYKSFTEYCQKTFDFGRSYGYRLIAYCNVWNLLHDDAKNTIPERVIRALCTVDNAEMRQKIWNSVRENSGGQLPTSEEVEKAVKSWKEEKRLRAANFDPNDNTSIFCHALNCKLQTEELVQDLIKESEGKNSRLLPAIKELLNNHTLDPEKHDVKLLKRKFLEMQKKQLELLLPEKSSVKKEGK